MTVGAGPDAEVQAMTCPEKMHKGSDWSGRFEPCGKPVKRRGLCGIHARSLELAEQRREEYTAEQRKRGELVDIAQRLTEQFGVAFWSSGRYITLDEEAARSLLEYPS